MRTHSPPKLAGTPVVDPYFRALKRDQVAPVMFKTLAREKLCRALRWAIGCGHHLSRRFKKRTLPTREPLVIKFEVRLLFPNPPSGSPNTLFQRLEDRWSSRLL